MDSLVERIGNLVTFESLPGFLDRFFYDATEEGSAEKGVLILLHDFLLAQKKLTYLRLSEEGEEEAGGFVYCSLLPGHRKTASIPGPHPMRRILRETLRTGSPCVVEDADSHPLIDNAVSPVKPDFGSAVCLPLKTSGISGLLYLDHARKGHFGPAACARLELLTNVVSVRIRELVSFRHQLLLSQAIAQFNAVLDKDKLIELALNAMYLRLGFGQVLFLRVKQDQLFGELERSLPERLKDDLPPDQCRLPIDLNDSLCKLLVLDRQLAAVTSLRRTSTGRVVALLNGRKEELRNAVWIRFLELLGLQPFLAVPICAPDQVIGVLACSRFGLPILLSAESRSFMKSLCEGLALAMERADRYQDMNERLGRVYEERLRREALASLASLVKDVSHGISSPVRSLISTCSIVDRALGRLGDAKVPASLVDELKGNVEQIRGASLFIRSYVSYLRDLARTEALEPVMRAASIEECITNAWHERVARFFPSVQFKADSADPGVPHFLFDPLQITSLLANLMMNAARAMQPAGGRISIHTQLQGDFVRISIEDEGPGIPEDLLRDLFSLERRMSPDWPGEGMGTGLLLCKEVVFRHRGNLEIRSTGGRHLRFYERGVDFTGEGARDQGTEVIIELPYRREG